jgi:hypothetical protein
MDQDEIEKTLDEIAKTLEALISAVNTQAMVLTELKVKSDCDDCGACRQSEFMQ